MQRSILRKRIRARLAATEILLRALSNKIFAENDIIITPEQYTILSLITDNKELYQRQLSEITLKDRANISRIIKILESKGLVQRTADSNGRQILKIKPTQNGIELSNKIQPLAKRIRQTATEGIPNEEMELFLNILDKIFCNMETKVSLQI